MRTGSRGAEGLEHIHFHVVPHPDPAFRGPFVFALRGGDTATQVPDRSGIRSPANPPRLRAHARCPGGRTRKVNLGAAQSTPCRGRESDIRNGVKTSTASQKAADTADQPILCTHTSHHCGHLQRTERRLGERLSRAHDVVDCAAVRYCPADRQPSCILYIADRVENSLFCRVGCGALISGLAQFADHGAVGDPPGLQRGRCGRHRGPRSTSRSVPMARSPPYAECEHQPQPAAHTQR